MPRIGRQHADRQAIGRWAIGQLAIGLLANSPLAAPLLQAQDGRAADTAYVSRQALRTGPDGLLAITADDVRRHVSVIAHDSMQGRDTPSPGLEQTARYVAGQFQALGLEPVADTSQWVQRYPLPGSAAVDKSVSILLFQSAPKHESKPAVDEQGSHVGFVRMIRVDSGIVLVSDTVVDGRARGAAGGGQGFMADMELAGPAPVVVAGPQTLESVQQANLRDKVVIYVPAPGSDTTLQRQVFERLRAANHVIVVADEDSAAFAARRRAAQAHPPVILDPFLPEAQRLHRWALYAWAPVIKGSLATGGFSLDDAQAATAPVVCELDANVLLQVRAADSTSGATAPNTLALLRGRDPSRVILLVAHMDHTGLRHGAADSIDNGANDNASGVAGLLALAKAFTQAGVQPRRSIAFAAVSGGSKGFWGSYNVLAQWSRIRTRTIELVINLDMIGRTPGDSLWVNGMAEVALPARPDWVAARQPKVPLTLVDGGTVVAPESDHFAFVRKAIPSLYVHAGMHDTFDAAAGDAAGAVDPEQEVRVLRFVYALTDELANATQTAGWTAEGRRRRLQIFGN